MPKKKKAFDKYMALYMVLGGVVAAVLMPTTLMLLVGLLSTLTAFIFTTQKSKLQCMTIGAMNLAGCFPFLLELWTGENSLPQSVGLIFEPSTIAWIYAAAAAGYALDWAITTLVSKMMQQRGVGRRAAIEKRQKDLIARWGKEVSGELPLDEKGFPIQTPKPESGD
jgi:hypothetical protein